jgi:hypothetical protein
MRTIESHKVNPANDTLMITVLDQPGSGGACHRYEIADGAGVMKVIEFQNGPIAEVGVNGITHEALLAILIDRLDGFQTGPYANASNAEALLHLVSAQAALHARTKERMARGVEGTHQA